jgi:hypothetical protein
VKEACLFIHDVGPVSPGIIYQDVVIIYLFGVEEFNGSQGIFTFLRLGVRTIAFGFRYFGLLLRDCGYVLSLIIIGASVNA